MSMKLTPAPPSREGGYAHRIHPRQPWRHYHGPRSTITWFFETFLFLCCFSQENFFPFRTQKVNSIRYFVSRFLYSSDYWTRYVFLFLGQSARCSYIVWTLKWKKGKKQIEKTSDHFKSIYRKNDINFLQWRTNKGNTVKLGYNEQFRTDQTRFVHCNRDSL